ncbi:hypothetical protein HBH70_036550 [Parastagonospora nodorum]|uniref:Uncharacterized protein n=1 Tax=Phaeosphaeria nodorum (strain SN15 / ATCC MYA-4574 / FGSC 10173) TaxID=321614 RepID=A0A7U2EV80_PHANO|nr:hypothetical protein HBH54_078410 [Parastagonospora nodorum]QRC93609.1 hypothetical protein JI435_404200 [Parastagonospora nodorum SN15]KAH3988536.1 hypothetical protein HBH51_001970 [Parastagonospora nodorum]KAH4004872.1 hypothetical protein HBI10_040470 [Parastagonospora nodorum]KAH4030715.1 hypothetical protein HBI13_023920 [Parastagonospora nodorum]
MFRPRHGILTPLYAYTGQFALPVSVPESMRCSSPCSANAGKAAKRDREFRATSCLSRFILRLLNTTRLICTAIF